MTWEPLLALLGQSNVVTVSASDVGHRDEACHASLAFKIRRGVKAADWQRKFGDIPFVLRPIREIILAAHQTPTSLATHAELAAFIDARLRGYPDLHRALRPYVRTAVENYLDAHEALEADIGPLTVRSVDPMAGVPTRQLTAWAIDYQTEDGGIRELRRTRMGTAHDGSDESDLRYAILAAHVLGSQRGSAATRVRVVEVGLGDGSSSVVVDMTPAEARAQFASVVRPAIEQFVDSTAKRPGFDCGDCKIGGCCTALIPLPGVLGQAGVGVASRSVSASDLRMHAQCPTQYLLNKIAHLPREHFGDTEAQTRGELVHRWLKVAHARGTGCQSSELLPPDDIHVVTGPLDTDEYAIAYPYLLWHVQNCPLTSPAVRFLSSDEALYGFDSDAEVVAASKPDLVYVEDSTTLVIRETKTTTASLPADEAAAFDKFLDVAWLITLAGGGLVAHHGLSDGRVELEVLSPSSAETYQWRTSDLPVLAMARGEVSRRVDAWHIDDAWIADPGPHCAWCPVRRWCPDADRGVPAAAAPSDADYDEDDEVPDF